MPREVLVASPIQGTLDSGTAANCTITFNEPGVIDLDRLVVQIENDIGSQATAVSLAALELTEIARITALTLNGTELLIKGRNTASPPAAIFDRRRSGNFVNFGKIRVASNDTLLVTAIYIQTAITGRFSVGVPMVPDRFVGQPEYPMPRMGGERYAGSPEATITDVDGTGNDITLTFDCDGWIDLGRLVVKASSLVTQAIASATANTGTHSSALDPVQANNLPIFLRQLVLRSDYNMIVGAGTVIAPNFCDHKRQQRLVDFGVHRVSAGDALVCTVALYEVTTVAFDNASASMGCPILPARQAA